MRLLERLVTALFAASAAFSGYACVALSEPIPEVFERLELPISLAILTGVWKLAGALALYVPHSPRLREWVYAGFVFEFSGAIVLHLSAGDSIAQTGGPISMLVLTLASYGLRRALTSESSEPKTSTDAPLPA